MSDAPPPPPAARRDLMESPVVLDGATTIGGQPLIWATVAIATATAFLLLTNALALDGWAAELPPSERVAKLNAATAGWRAATEEVGAAAPRAAVHRAWQAAQHARFPGQAPAAAAE